MDERFEKCPHCGSNWGFYTKTTLVNVPYNWSFDGEAQDNSEMYDNAEHYKSGAYCYCQNCDKVICKVSTMARLLGRTEL